jgi:hypothetical protein
VPSQQLGDGLARSAFEAQFNDYLAPRLKVLESWSPTRLKFGGSLPDGIRVSDGHKMGRRRVNARQLRRRCRRMVVGNAAETSVMFGGRMPGNIRSSSRQLPGD